MKTNSFFVALSRLAFGKFVSVLGLVAAATLDLGHNFGSTTDAEDKLGASLLVVDALLSLRESLDGLDFVAA